MDIEEIKEKKMKELKERMSFPDKPIEITNDNSEENKKKYPLLIIDCWAIWCTPCLIIAPMIKKLAKEYNGKIVFGKLNVDQNRELAMKYNIMSIPTLLVFKNGELVDRIIGAMPYDVLNSKIKTYLEKS